ncbi:unnamed protein product [Paramecium sonneborni]|uniref:Uncharacterized protein n=1 Tax=Paramecium sonneborni TaxID=65129 RepID=A0A8S1LPV9_9CILI|nr:unnamed protein product [Paramecium sonneborni]
MQIQSFDELATEKEIKLFGKTTSQKFQRLKIIIIGLSSLGLEIAKHISTQQPELIKLCDIQLQRLKQCEQLLKINNVIQIETLEMYYKENEILQKIEKHDLTIICDIQSLKFAIGVSEHLRSNASQNQKNNKGVIWTCTFGFICLKFSDFGQGFKVFDRDGVQPFPYHIVNITNSNPGFVQNHNSIPHNYKTGDFVRISNVEVNGPEARPIKIISQTEFSIGHTQHYEKYLAGGLVQLTKVPFKYQFQKLSETIYNYKILKKQMKIKLFITLLKLNYNHKMLQLQEVEELDVRLFDYFHQWNVVLSHISKLTILADDIVLKYTLETHIWFNQQTFGMLKADVAQQQAQLLSSTINIDVDKNKFSEKSEIIVKQHEIIFSAINNQTSRILIQQQAQKHNKVLFDQILNGLKAYTQFGKPNQQLQIQELQKMYIMLIKILIRNFLIFLFIVYSGLQKYLIIVLLVLLLIFQNSYMIEMDIYKTLKNQMQLIILGLITITLEAHVINRISKPGFNLTLDKILSLSKELYEFHFEFKITQLLKQYPIDALECVWTGYKKIPQPMKFDSNNMDHVAYIQITTLLISKLFNINVSAVFKQEYVIDKLQQMTEIIGIQLILKFPTEYSSQNKPQFLNFDDDQVRGLYVRCIHSLTNLRCTNYNLQPIPLYKVQKYALEMQRSNPIMHSIIVGWMRIELYKYLYGNCKQRNMHIDVNSNILEFK